MTFAGISLDALAIKGKIMILSKILACTKVMIANNKINKKQHNCMTLINQRGAISWPTVDTE